MINPIRPAVLMLTALLAGCDAVIDCLDNDGPEFDKVTLGPAVLNQVYSEYIRASVNNEPQDQRFDYDFVLSGELPMGLSYEDFGQRFHFTGTPTVSGNFPVSLYVEVDDGLDAQESGLCYVSHTRDFVLVVSEM